MNIKIIRRYKKDNYTIGDLYLNGEWYCNTLEDTDRGLTDNMDLADIMNTKVYGRTAIPTGKYQVTITYSPKFRTKLPLINAVKGFTAIRIHSGNTHQHTSGCILVGFNTIKGQLTNSKNCLIKLNSILMNTEEDIILDII